MTNDDCKRDGAGLRLLRPAPSGVSVMFHMAVAAVVLNMAVAAVVLNVAVAATMTVTVRG